jgi:hypothetical protein
MRCVLVDENTASPRGGKDRSDAGPRRREYERRRRANMTSKQLAALRKYQREYQRKRHANMTSIRIAPYRLV